MNRQLHGRRALVTGGTRGIGRAVSLRLAAEGADVALNYLSKDDAAHRACQEVEEFGGRAVLVRGDVADPAQANAVAEAARQALGPLDILVHCAGLAVVEPADEVTWESWRRLLSVNLDGSFNALYAVKDGMIRRGYGRIVMISSIAALRPRPQLLHYSVAKAGVLALVRSSAGAWAQHGLRINAVCPGMIDTEAVSRAPAGFVAAALEAVPMGRIGQPEEIAAVVNFLLSDEASYITGQTVVASGGRVMLT